jgi:uncharacterized protein YbjQ (UPF0145 family)
MDFTIFIALLALGYFAGTWAEKQHYASIEAREAGTLQLPLVNGRNGYAEESVVQAIMVHGSAVISVDYFKRILATLRNVFGGTVRSYETLLDRARREALLRMKESAPAGTKIIINVRVETAAIGNNTHKRSVGCVEALAYGTALISTE